MDVRQIMTSPVVTVDSTANLHEVVGTMLEHRIGSVLVTNSVIEGIVTRSDILRAAYHLDGSLADIPVTRAMTKEVVTTTPETSVNRVLEIMAEHNIKKLPVVAEFDVTGILTMTDIAEHQPERVREVRGAIDRKDDWTD